MKPIQNTTRLCSGECIGYDNYGRPKIICHKGEYKEVERTQTMTKYDLFCHYHEHWVHTLKQRGVL